MLLLRGATSSPAEAPAAILRFNTCSSCEEQLDGLTIDSELFRFNTCSSCEEQLHAKSGSTSLCMFQYMLLLRGATRMAALSATMRLFQYMLLLRGATDPPSLSGVVGDVSIHAPLARSNYTPSALTIRASGFNTCSSCEEQPAGNHARAGRQGFNTCSSCEEQLLRPVIRLSTVLVSIHAPLARSNPPRSQRIPCRRFQYMLLLRGAKRRKEALSTMRTVSIHAPLARSNQGFQLQCQKFPFQYMLLLRGATKLSSSAQPPLMFQYMLLLRGAT